MATREAIRQAVGENLDALHTIRPTISNASTLHIPSYYVSTNDAGGYVYYKDQQAVVSASVIESTQGVLSIEPDFVGITIGDEVEFWTDQRWGPNRINGLINQAIRECLRKIYTYAPPYYVNATSRSRHLPIPDDWDMVQAVSGRMSFGYGHHFENIYTSEEFALESGPAGETVEVEQDFYDYRGLSRAVRTSYPVAGSYVLEVQFSTRRLTGMTHYEGWFKATSGITSITMAVRDGTDNLEGPIDIWDGDDADDEWKYVQIPIADPRKIKDADNIRFTIVAASEGVVWFNGLWGVDQQSVNWQEYDRRAWRIEHSNREIEIIPQSELDQAPWALVRIVGGRDPIPFTDDETDIEIDDFFLIARATELALSSVSGSRDTDPDNYRQLSQHWHGRSLQARRSAFPNMVNIRRIRKVE